MLFQILVFTLLVLCVKTQTTQVDVNIPSRLIIGGRDCNPLAFEYFVTFKPTGKEKRNLCGGSIISPLYILTCAHCCADFEGGFILTAPEREKMKWKFREKIIVDSVTVHNNYNSKNHDYDYAILKLARKITIKGAEIVQLANRSFTRGMFKQENPLVLAMGFGSNILSEDGLPAKDFNKGFQCLDMPASRPRECLSEKNMYKRDRMFCSISPDDTQESAGPGDSGGPVVFKNVQVGIISTGFAGRMTIFARVDAVLDWINQIKDQDADVIVRSNGVQTIAQSGVVISSLAGYVLNRL